MPRPSMWTIALRSLKYFVRAHAAVALGIAAATAVLVGALVVGDSVRGSLRKLVVDRLANIECLLHASVFFNPELLSELASGHEQVEVVPCIILSSSTVEKRTNEQVTRASRVQVLAVGAEFWETVDIDGPAPELGTDCVVLNRSLAIELGVTVGDEVSVRMEQAVGVPNDNPLGKRDDNSVNLPRQQVVAILPDAGVGGLSFRATQAVPRNVFASIATVQDILDCQETVNAALVLGGQALTPSGTQGQQLCDELNLQIRPSLEDFGLQFARHKRVFPDESVDDDSLAGRSPETVYDYFQLSSKELILDDATSNAVMRKFGNDQATRLISYLANSIAKIEPLPSDLAESRSALFWEMQHPETPQQRDANAGLQPTAGLFLVDDSAFSQGPMAALGLELGDSADGPDSNTRQQIPLLSREVPYSIIVGVDRPSELNLENYLEIPSDDLQYSYCWVNTWLAKQINVTAGDWFQATYFEPETVDGKEVEKSARFMVAGIVPLTEPERGFNRRNAASYKFPPTIFNDAGLTPTVPGVTDQDSISNWDTPFPLENEITAADDQYWNNHRLTPKVFVPYRYAVSKGMFASRFGNTTAIRISAVPGASETKLRATIEESLLETRAQKGLAFQPIRARQLEAASGTTPFDMLFLSLSFFVIVAALLLVLLLFRLSIQQRVSEIGILLAQGFTPAAIRGLFLRELTVVAVVGSILGVLLGLGYARAMIAGLESWWLGAIATRFLGFFATGQSLAIGALGGFCTSLLAIYFGLKRLSRLEPLAAIGGQTAESATSSSRLSRTRLALAGFVALGACGLIAAGIGQSGMPRAGSFFGSGMLLLIATLLVVRHWIESVRSATHNLESCSLFQLARRSVCRNPLRSSLALGLLSVATFLIVSMGVFQIRPTEKGYGGFNLLAESSQPIYRNIASGKVRSDVLGDEASLLSDTSIVPMRARNGDDASCNNLFQVSQPTILGVTERLRELHEFAPESVAFEWAAASNPANPWAPLAAPADGSESNPIPVILDQNTAAWSLKQGSRLGSIVRLRLDNRFVHFRTVGLLSNSVLQGKLLIGQENFKGRFPELSGFSFFLIRSGREQKPKEIAQLLERGWSGAGLDVTDSATTLAHYLGVQNTYISAFQSLGALGLLLGTFGLIAVQIRSVLERKREFALMRAIGFAPDRIARQLVAETAILLGGGLLIGLLCAAVALVPYIIEVGPQLSLVNPIIMLAAVLAVGFLAAFLAVRTATKQPVLEALTSQ